MIKKKEKTVIAEKREKAVILASGGVDSSVTLALSAMKFQLSAVTFDYAQRSANGEIAGARRVARHFGVPLEVIDISGIRRSFLGLTSGTTVNLGFDGTVLNCPHAILGLATTYTVLSGATTLITGVHKEDLDTLPGGQRYFEEYGKMMRDFLGIAFELETPFLRKTKADIIRAGSEINFPFELTHSCTMLADEHCGMCPSCVRRSQAFREARVGDTAPYAK